jgi:DNA-binding NtrC family response regulator
MTYKILIVDDEPVNLRTLSRLLRSNYDVVTAESGDEALIVLHQHNVALLISDQRMPGMTGIELMKNTVALRPQMVKILLTGYTDVDALIESINCGLVYRYLTKPWNNDDLKLTVARALEHYEATKSGHLLEMENKRLRIRLSQISELALEGIEETRVRPPEVGAHFVERLAGRLIDEQNASDSVA